MFRLSMTSIFINACSIAMVSNLSLRMVQYFYTDRVERKLSSDYSFTFSWQNKQRLLLETKRNKIRQRSIVEWKRERSRNESALLFSAKSRPYTHRDVISSEPERREPIATYASIRVFTFVTQRPSQFCRRGFISLRCVSLPLKSCWVKRYWK